MAVCIPFLRVRNIGETIQWYEQLGFVCTATNRIWEPDCELNWARLAWEEAAFMIGPDERHEKSANKDSSLWFNVTSIDDIIEMLKSKSVPIIIEPETFYGRKVVNFSDLNGFGVSFSCEIPGS